MLQPADYAFLGLAAVITVTGLFRGFSGTVAFLCASAGSAAAGAVCWTASARWLDAAWARGGATLVAALLAFGLVRLAVKKMVNGLLSQPSDALFGMVAGVAASILLLAGWAYSGLYTEYSSLASFACELLSGR